MHGEPRDDVKLCPSDAGRLFAPPIHNAMRKEGLEKSVGHDCDVRATGFGH